MRCEIWSARGRPRLPESSVVLDRVGSVASPSLLLKATNSEAGGHSPPAGVPQYEGVGEEKLPMGLEPNTCDSGVAGKAGPLGLEDLVGV